jgi:membrane-associated phospholipid phosphatase
MAMIIFLIHIDIKYDAYFMNDHDVNDDRNIFLIFFCVAIVLSLVTGLSRVYFAVHYPRDVIVGYILGVLIGLLVYSKTSPIWAPSGPVKSAHFMEVLTIGRFLLFLITY